MSSKWIAEVFLVAENRLLREALVRILEKKNDIRIVGASPYSQSVHEEIVAARPGMIVLDSSGLDSSKLGLISTLQESIPVAKIVMVDMDSDENVFLKAVREGVMGYVLKDASAMEVARTIRAVAGGEAVCPPALSAVLFRAISRQGYSSSTSALGSELGLSRREQQLVELLRERLTNKEIATQLNLSEQTVKNHVHNMLRKLGASDRLTIVERCDPERFRTGSTMRD